VAVLDVRLPDGDGVSVCRDIRSRAPGVACLIFTAFTDDQALLDSILAGASSFNLFGGGTSNKSSRLYRALVETGLAAGVSAGLSPTVEPYLYSIACTVRSGQTPEAVEKALDAEMERARSEPVSEQELAKAVKQARAIFSYGAESVTNQGYWLGVTEVFDNYRWFETYLERLAAVTVADVQRVAQKYLARTNRTVGAFTPEANGQPAGPLDEDDHGE